jgi:hypothetical protein
VPEDDPEFQGLLEEKEPAAYLDVLAELPGVELESEKAIFQVMMDKPEPNFAELAATALDNAGLDPDNRLQHTQDVLANAVQAEDAQIPAIVEANHEEVVYEIMFDLPDGGAEGSRGPPGCAYSSQRTGKHSCAHGCGCCHCG